MEHQCLLGGGHDPSRTKVLHFSMNPASLAKQQRQEQMGNLREECERLRERIRILEGGDGGGTSSTSSKLEGGVNLQSYPEIAGPTDPWVDVPQPPRCSEESQGLEWLRGLPRGDSELITIHAVEGTSVVVTSKTAAKREQFCSNVGKAHWSTTLSFLPVVSCSSRKGLASEGSGPLSFKGECNPIPAKPTAKRRPCRLTKGLHSKLPKVVKRHVT
ncbi:hypothetical protein L345_06264, partial [Ophiophagus hannah]